MSTQRREIRLKLKEVLAKYQIDDLELEIELTDLFKSYMQSSLERKGTLESLAQGAEVASSIRDEVRKCLLINPNPGTQTGQAFFLFLRRTSESGETVSKFSEWYWKNDWRGQKGQPPSISLVMELWPAAFVNQGVAQVGNDGGFYV